MDTTTAAPLNNLEHRDGGIVGEDPPPARGPGERSAAVDVFVAALTERPGQCAIYTTVRNANSFNVRRTVAKALRRLGLDAGFTAETTSRRVDANTERVYARVVPRDPS